MKNLLIIAYHFHPDMAVGAVRSVKFAKYLPEHSWKPIILTVKSKYYGDRDENPLDFQCEIYRTCKWMVLDDIYKKIKSLFRISRNTVSKGSDTISFESEITDNFFKTGIPLWKRIVNTLSRIPDDKMGWIFPGILKAIKIILKRKVTIIYSSGPPFSCHIIGMIAHKITKKKWIADFRDPWTLAVKSEEIETAMSKRIEKFLEKQVVSNANLVLTSTPELKKAMEDIYPLQLKNKCYSILNGFDEDDFRHKRKVKYGGEDRVDFLYAGNLYKGRDPFTFLVSIGELLESGYIEHNDIRISFYGKISIGSLNIGRAINEFHLEKILKFNPPVGRNAYIDLIVNSDVLILIQAPTQASLIPAKVFDYLATGNKIIALVPAGAAANFLGAFENVSVADLFNKEQIKKSIINILRELKNGYKPVTAGDELLKEITRRKLTEKFSNLLTRINDGVL